MEGSHPLTAEEVLRIGRDMVRSLNLATVYRNLKMLTDTGWLARFNHPILGTMYERSGKDHHHHFHGRTCHRVFDIPGCALNKDHPFPVGFITEGHEVFLFGVCPSCAA
jgi:Fur family ferric uptake transcriptional regulator